LSYVVLAYNCQFLFLQLPPPCKSVPISFKKLSFPLSCKHQSKIKKNEKQSEKQSNNNKKIRGHTLLLVGYVHTAASPNTFS
jgi:hypothetical protein